MYGEEFDVLQCILLAAWAYVVTAPHVISNIASQPSRLQWDGVMVAIGRVDSLVGRMAVLVAPPCC